MTLDQIANMVLEGIRAHRIVDDEDIDLRLIKDWIHLKRVQYIQNITKNPQARISLGNYQMLPVNVEVQNNSEVGSYPFIDTDERQDNKMVVSTATIPRIVEKDTGLMVYSIESLDNMKYAFTFVDYEYLKVAGNGKFNRNLIFSAIRDNLLYFKYHELFDTNSVVVIRALFENPTTVPGFTDDTTNYPCSPEIIEYIKNAIFDKDARMAFTAKNDQENNANGEV